MTGDGVASGELLHGDREIAAVVRRAGARLARVAGRDSLRRRWRWVLGAGALAAACRPLVLRLSDDAPRWAAVPRSLAFFAAGSAAAAVALVVLGRRRRPSELGAARAIDEALGLSEVVASGFAFAREAREEPISLLARRRAAAASTSARVDALFPLPELRPSLRSAARFALCAALAVAVGSYDRGLVLALVSPPTAGEREAAAELDAAAAALDAHAEKRDAGDPPVPPLGRDQGADRGGERGPALGEMAREAARAARRGDRRGALEKLEGVRSAGARQASRAEGIRAALRKIAEALDPASPGKSGASGSAKAVTPGAGAAESMHLLAQKMRSAEGGSGSGSGSDDTSSERLLQRLERAGEEARRAAAEGRSPGASEAARSLSRAAEALQRGDRRAAAEALEQAAERAAAMDRMRAAAAAEADAIAELLERSGGLEQAIQAALLGREGQGDSKGDRDLAMGEGASQGEGKGEKGSGKGGGAGALRAAIQARLAAMGAPQPEGDPGTGSGPHVPDRHRARRDPLVASGSLRAPSQVTEGARAIQAIHGLGRGTEPPASYREVFPSYDAAAEEGMADERIPARRRAAVRRYFQSIRPDQP